MYCEDLPSPSRRYPSHNPRRCVSPLASLLRPVSSNHHAEAENPTSIAAWPRPRHDNDKRLVLRVECRSISTQGQMTKDKDKRRTDCRSLPVQRQKTKNQERDGGNFFDMCSKLFRVQRSGPSGLRETPPISQPLASGPRCGDVTCSNHKG